MIIVIKPGELPDQFTVRFRYHPKLIELIKNLPSYTRWWDHEDKTWTIEGRGYCQGFADRVRRSGHGVNWEGEEDDLFGEGDPFEDWEDASPPPPPPPPRDPPPRPPPRDPPPRPPPRARVATWADTLFSAVGAERREPVFKALSRVLHPDVGGSTELMQQLNEARRRAAV